MTEDQESASSEEAESKEAPSTAELLERQKEIDDALAQIDQLVERDSPGQTHDAETVVTGPTGATGATWSISSSPFSGYYNTGVSELYSLGSRTNDYLDQLDREQDIGLKGRYASFILWLLGGQLFIADAIFFVYAQVGAHWQLPPVVIDIWLGATLVEVVGIVLVVTRYLFPRRDTQA